MPNNVVTKIVFEGDPEKIDIIFDLIKGEDGSDQEKEAIDFDKLIPMPDNIFRGDLGQKERELYGEDTWYYWCRKNWGTKWNAYDSDRDGNVLIFETAWNLPDPILLKLTELCNNHGVSFTGSWISEDWASYGGTFEIDPETNELNIFDFDDEESLAELCEELMGFNPLRDE